MTVREFNSHAEVDVVRIGVLGAISRGMGFSYAARADGITVAQVREIAEAAGWPDIDAVRASWEDLKASTRHAHLPAGAVPLERVVQAQREYRGEVVQAGPIPEHLEPLADYVARVGSQLVPVEETGPPETCEHGYTEGDCDQFGCDPLCAHGCADGDCPDTGCPFTHQSPATAGPLPPTTDSPDVTRADVDAAVTAAAAYKEATLPCEVCGVGVLKSFADRTGRQRHGHHPEGT